MHTKAGRIARVTMEYSMVKQQLTGLSGVEHVSFVNESPTFVNGGYGVGGADMPENTYRMITGLPVDEGFVMMGNHMGSPVRLYYWMDFVCFIAS